MRIIVDDTGISTGSLFKLVWTGYVIGTGIFVVPSILFVILAVILSPHEGFESEGVLVVVGAPFMAAGMLAVQGLMIGGIIVIGLGIYRKFRTIEVRRPAA